jgi:hypothetical protein
MKAEYKTLYGSQKLGRYRSLPLLQRSARADHPCGSSTCHEVQTKLALEIRK